MGMYDYYAPDPPLSCRGCGQELTDFQGKDGPCELLVWTEGSAAPAKQLGDPDFRRPPDEIERYRLDQHAGIYTSCPACDAFTEATAFVESGVWRGTVHGYHPSPDIVTATFVQDLWRQCSACADAFEERLDRTLSECPYCRNVTRAEGLVLVGSPESESSKPALGARSNRRVLERRFFEDLQRAVDTLGRVPGLRLAYVVDKNGQLVTQVGSAPSAASSLSDLLAPEPESLDQLKRAGHVTVRLKQMDARVELVDRTFILAMLLTFPRDGEAMETALDAVRRGLRARRSPPLRTMTSTRCSRTNRYVDAEAGEQSAPAQ